jgi:uncharacterized protein DUF3124
MSSEAKTAVLADRGMRDSAAQIHRRDLDRNPIGQGNSMRIELWLLCLTLLSCGNAFAESSSAQSSGESLYLPIYSHIWHGDPDAGGEPVRTLVSISVSIRNTDPAKPIRITSAQYYDTDGRKIKDYLPSGKTIGPMGTLELFVPRGDDTGGSGANFVISWRADAPASPPIVEGIHANLPTGRAIVFVTTARKIAQ